ncbi:hypothetical protein TCAL_16965 [Tigriopus californicus]|uniref:MADF domain-containing protein n=1 Tax=Tigriopus californicus TaxID=6832 RepID=A0A553PI28_TIGCA|nr:hypothetical protein TCAL_16965 [Tigriopus californicus]
MARKNGGKEIRDNELQPVKEDLIGLVKNQEAIWLSSHVDHMNKEKVLNAWITILAALKNDHKDVLQKFDLGSIPALKAMWKNLRAYFFSKKKTLQLPSGSGATCTSDPRSQWPFYKNLEFLSSSTIHLQTECGIFAEPTNDSTNNTQGTVHEESEWEQLTNNAELVVEVKRDDLLEEGNLDMNGTRDEDALQETLVSQNHAATHVGKHKASWTPRQQRKKQRSSNDVIETADQSRNAFRDKYCEALTNLAKRPEIDSANAFAQFMLPSARTLEFQAMEGFAKAHRRVDETRTAGVTGTGLRTLEVGDFVHVQYQIDKDWSFSADVVRSMSKSGRSYMIATSAGEFVQNRRFFRPARTGSIFDDATNLPNTTQEPISLPRRSTRKAKKTV